MQNSSNKKYYSEVATAINGFLQVYENTNVGKFLKYGLDIAFNELMDGELFRDRHELPDFALIIGYYNKELDMLKDVYLYRQDNVCYKCGGKFYGQCGIIICEDCFHKVFLGQYDSVIRECKECVSYKMETCQAKELIDNGRKEEVNL